MAGSTENPMEKVLRHLDTPGPDAAMACATLCMIMSQPQRGAMNLSGVADKVLKLITSPDHHIQVGWGAPCPIVLPLHSAAVFL
jgi:hypothetical protein